MTLQILSTSFQAATKESKKLSGAGKSIACHRLQVGRWLGAPAVGALLLFGMLSVPVSGWAQFIQMDLAVDVKSRFSDGCSSVQELQTLAQHRGLDGLIFGDHDRKSESSAPGLRHAPAPAGYHSGDRVNSSDPVL